MNFSARIKELCKERGILLKDLAARLNITAIGLSQSINQEYPQLQTLERIANALDVEVSELFAPKEDFIAFVRINGETQTFTRMYDLLCWIHGIERADNSSTQEKEAEISSTQETEGNGSNAQ